MGLSRIVLFTHLFAVHRLLPCTTQAIKFPVLTLRKGYSSHRALKDNNKMGRQTTARRPDPQRRVLRPRKRPQAIAAKSNTVKRPNTRMLRKKPTDLLTNTTDYEDGVYTPEFEEIDLWQGRRLPINVPISVKLRKKIVRLEKQIGGPLPGELLHGMILPSLTRFSREVKAKGLEYSEHLFELWRMNDTRNLPVDNSFAATFFTQIEQMSRTTSAARVCTRCTSIWLSRSTQVRDDERRMRWCRICNYLSESNLNAIDEARVALNHRVCAAPGRSTRYS